ncbi:degenerin mec-10-like [Penaeus japonicus]|uniref:degenerin mec-10-like n=1 Tax=Penaeus japonicus TaxID=27405 RepID=UPI001C710522|nr:degenerin mec-10-like [Penaeus japonicus]
MKWSRLPSPYKSNCAEDWVATSYNYQEGNMTTNYTYSSCMRICMQRIIQDSCECCHPYYPGMFFYDSIPYDCARFDPCNLTSTSPVNRCVKNVTDLFAADQFSCNCPLACTETQYPVVLSTSKWPPKTSKRYVDSVLLDDMGQDVEDLLKVSVFFYTLDVYQVVETEVYEKASTENV